uniref:Transcription initiation factor TFIID subunit 12 n=1 Tax=Bos indicus x Bos taurus TaxID=30522 RepID=A0A4W2CJR6_BOBOX
MNQFGPSALINLSNFSSIKPEPASTPPQGSMASSTAVVKIPGTPGTGGRLSPESNQVLTKKKLQDLVREVDPNEQLDEDVEENASGTCGSQGLALKKSDPTKKLAPQKLTENGVDPENNQEITHGKLRGWTAMYSEILELRPQPSHPWIFFF